MRFKFEHILIIFLILFAANVLSTELRFEFKRQKNLAMARQIKGFHLEIWMI